MPLAADSLLLDVTRMAGGRLVAVGERGHIVTSDDGSSWKQTAGVPTRSTLTSVTSHGEQIWAAGHDSVILHSADAGQTWTLLMFDPERQQPVMDIWFADAANGFALGAYGLMLATTDGGQTWEEQFVSPDEWHLNSLLDLGGGTLVVAAEAGFSYRSLDGGQSWEEIEMPYPGSMFGLIDAQNGCILMVGLRGHVQESCDVGISWTETQTATQSSLGNAVKTGDLTVVVGNSGAVLTRIGDGEFGVTYHSSGVDFSGVVALGDGRFLLVGEEGIHHYPEDGGAGS